MVQFNLPDNSKLVEGEYYKSATESDNIKNFRVYRWSPDDEKNPRVDTYEAVSYTHLTLPTTPYV